ncbi:hypothetical protein ACH4S8_37220 [Streptomyces sp. NPDC021080]|uniref:hypothetical protein n=1 Tax=Streptomyces sp. NPDC021080 TaxID=3365110 RepID=UPI00379E1D00
MSGDQPRPSPSPRGEPPDDEPPRSRIPLRGYALAAGALFVGIFGGWSMGADSIPPASAPGALTAAQHPTRLTVPGDGTYWVGADVRPGLYRSLPNSDRCSWTRAKDATGERTSVRAHKASTGTLYVYLSRGDFFDTRDCHTWRRVKMTSRRQP